MWYSLNYLVNENRLAPILVSVFTMNLTNNVLVQSDKTCWTMVDGIRLISFRCQVSGDNNIVFLRRQSLQPKADLVC